jgi:tRNA threonylcarbamoyladenosine biosynthesis protein TsaB
MTETVSAFESQPEDGLSAAGLPFGAGYLLAMDTCGAVGSVALGGFTEDRVVVFSQCTLSAGEFSSELLPAVEGLLRERELTAASLTGIVAVAGPGSFTGIRIGLAAAKALVSALEIPIVTLSRLKLLAHLAQAPCAVLDAHRGQFFSGFYGQDAPREILVTAGEMNAMGGLTGRVAVCEESVAQLLEELQGSPEILRLPQPLAADALIFSLAQWQARNYADPTALDGHYLRGADAKPSTKSL